MTDAESDDLWRRVEAEFGGGDESGGCDLEGEVADLVREVGTLEDEIKDIRQRVGWLEQRHTFAEGLSEWWGTVSILLWMVALAGLFAVLAAKACS